MNKRVALVTGATSGIGLETALLLLKHGFIVYGIGRRTADIPGIRCLRADITDNRSVQAAFDTLIHECGRLDLLINNAGMGIAGAVEFTDDPDILSQFQVNLLGTVRPIRLAIPLLRASRGRIINISSAAAIFPIPFQAYYSASKAALNALSLALKNELRPFGISFCCIMPGDVISGFTQARIKNLPPNLIYGERINNSVAAMEHDELHGMSPKFAASKIIRIALADNPPPLSALGFNYKLLILLERLLPKRFLCFLLSRLYGGT